MSGPIARALTLLAAASGLAACAAPAAGPKPPSEVVSIQTDRQIYSPIMSSTVGIGLTPRLQPAAAEGQVLFHWRASYGLFLSWSAPDYKVRGLGPETSNRGGRIYWSYAPDELGRDKPAVIISVTAQDARTGSALSSAQLRLHWKDAGTAEVLPAAAGR
jgi:hypothetical protein